MASIPNRDLYITCSQISYWYFPSIPSLFKWPEYLMSKKCWYVKRLSIIVIMLLPECSAMLSNFQCNWCSIETHSVNGLKWSINMLNVRQKKIGHISLNGLIRLGKNWTDIELSTRLLYNDFQSVENGNLVWRHWKSWNFDRVTGRHARYRIKAIKQFFFRIFNGAFMFSMPNLVFHF